MAKFWAPAALVSALGLGLGWTAVAEGPGNPAGTPVPVER
jgi:hypothetical protein